MIVGEVSEAGVPVITLEVAGREWPAVVDTGFNGDLELPLELRSALAARYIGRITSALGGGQRIEEDAYLVEVPFDGKAVLAEATFVESQEILIGTHLLQSHRLEVVFPKNTVTFERQ